MTTPTQGQEGQGQAPTTAKAPPTIAGGGQPQLAHGQPKPDIHKLIAQTQGDPAAAAKLLKDNPAVRAELLEAMQTDFGNDAVQKILQESRVGNAETGDAQLKPIGKHAASSGAA